MQFLPSGALRPVATPVIAAEGSPSPRLVAENEPAPSESAEDILNKYLQAVGGSAAIEKISSEVQKGKLNLAQGVQFPMEIYLKQPGMRSVVTHLPSGVGFETVNGQSGWTLFQGVLCET